MNKLPLPWGRKVSAEFRSILYEGCSNMGWSDSAPGKLMACMAWETGETFSPKVKNPRSSATGLIQFMDATAKDLGTTTAMLAGMTAEQQLRWCFKYFQSKPKVLRGPNATLSDIYMAIFMPSMIGKPENEAIKLTPVQYKVNSGLDVNKDMVITKRECASKVMEKYEKGMRDPYVFIEK